MTSEIPLFSSLVLLAAGQGLFLALALMSSKTGNWQANRYLGLFTLTVALNMVDYGIDATVTNDSATYLRALLWPRDYLYGVAFYFYVREMTLPGKHLLFPRQWLHFLPALVHMAFFWSLPFLNAPLSHALLSGSDHPSPEIESSVNTIVNIEVFTSILHLAIYLWLSIRVLNAHRVRIKSTFSYDEHISLGWLRKLLFGVLAVYLIWVFEELFSAFTNLADGSDSVISASLVILIYSMSYLGLRQPVIFTGKTAEVVLTECDNGKGRQREIEKDTHDEKDTHYEKEIHVEKENTTKYRTSSLTDDLSQQLVEELQQLMTQDKPYLDSQLSLPQLAEKLGVSANYLSQIINEQLEQNFFEFVNGYRIEEAKGVLNDAQRGKENILTIALESGFASKSSFYTAFRKQTGLTPGAYRKQVE